MMEYINFIIKKRIKNIAQIQQVVLLKYVIDLKFFFHGVLMYGLSFQNFQQPILH